MLLILILSIALNIYLFRKNKQLKCQLNHSPVYENHSIDTHPSHYQEENLAADSENLSLIGLETELDKSHQPIQSHKSIELDEIELSEEINQTEYAIEKSRLQSALEILSGWHKSLVPFLLQNIGWFIGILCFISGSVFFISYTEGFTKSITIFYTILSYTLLLAWAGYRLKDRLAHASQSANVLMAISLLLVPLNFTAVTRLILNSIGTGQYSIAVISTIIAFISLFYSSKLITGVFNRQLLAYFLPAFIALSSIQLIIPVIATTQNIMLFMLLQAFIITLLLVALIKYIPTVLKKVFVDRKYLVLFSVSCLIYSATISIIHISLSSTVSIAISYYAPILMLISGALFYIDGQLKDYKNQNPLLSWFSIIAYLVSFSALFLSLDSQALRIITLLMGSVLYARLMWTYQSLAPLYLVSLLLCVLHYDVILSNLTNNTGSVYSWYYLASLPLVSLFASALLFLRKGDKQRTENFKQSRHLFYLIIYSIFTLSILSQWYISNAAIALINSLTAILSSYYLLNSTRFNIRELLGETRSGERTYSAIVYLLLLLPFIHLLQSTQLILSINMSLALFTLLSLFYSVNSQYHFVTVTLSSFSEKGKQKNQALWVNSSLMISFIMLLLAGINFTLSIKTGILFLFISMNFLYLSVSLYNRALFYGFILIASVSVLVFKLSLHTGTSTGLLTISFVLVVFFILNWLDKNKSDEIEQFKSLTIAQSKPDKILWFYPGNDYAIDKSLQPKHEIICCRYEYIKSSYKTVDNFMFYKSNDIQKEIKNV